MAMLNIFVGDYLENKRWTTQRYKSTCVNGACKLWHDFRSFIDPTGPAEPLLKESEGLLSAECTSWGFVVNFDITVFDPLKPSEVKGLQKNEKVLIKFLLWF